MTVWAVIIFLMGLIALIQYLSGTYTWFVPVWSVLLMFISLAIFTRISNREKHGEKEVLKRKIEDLERELKAVTANPAPKASE
ncbi:MAG: hypothetical protein AB1393_01115 [Candidatus Edwardsbacteria bacterium]